MIATVEHLMVVGMFAVILIAMGVTAAIGLMLWVWALMNQVDPTSVV